MLKKYRGKLFTVQELVDKELIEVDYGVDLELDLANFGDTDGVYRACDEAPSSHNTIAFGMLPHFGNIIFLSVFVEGQYASLDGKWWYPATWFEYVQSKSEVHNVEKL